MERKIPLKLKTMVMTLNRHELGAMKAYAEGLGVEFCYDAQLNAGLDGGRKPVELRIPPEEVVHLDVEDDKRLKSWQEFLESPYSKPHKTEHLYLCGAGRNSFHIDSFGQLSACMMSRVPSYDLFEGSFHEGWYDFIPNVLKQKWSQETPCQSCEYYAGLCSQCPGWAQLESGDREKPVDYLCQIAHLRAEAFGVSQ